MSVHFVEILINNLNLKFYCSIFKILILKYNGKQLILSFVFFNSLWKYGRQLWFTGSFFYNFILCR